MKIYYRTGFNNQLSDKFIISHDLLPKESVSTKWLSLHNQILTIEEGYGWDGDTGLIEQNKCTVLASCVHDALYDLLRRGLIHYSYRLQADQLYLELAILGGLPRLRAMVRYYAIRWFGEPHSLSSAIKPPLSAP